MKTADGKTLRKVSERTNVGTGDSDGESEKCSTKKRGDNQLTRKEGEEMKV